MVVRFKNKFSLVFVKCCNNGVEKSIAAMSGEGEGGGRFNGAKKSTPTKGTYRIYTESMYQILAT